MPMIDVTKWEEFYKEMNDGLKPYDHYDDGYRDAMDNVDDWMDENQVEVDPVRHGRWLVDSRTGMSFCSECLDYAVEADTNYCPNCGAKMRLEE